MKKLFGTDGIRGLVNDSNINSEMAFKLGRALIKYCQFLNLPARIIIGRDTRESGPLLESALVQGIKSLGGEVVSAGVIPTPGLAFLAKNEGVGFGVVISASHNPFEYNGFKIFKNDGTKLTDQEEKDLEELILAEEASAPKSSENDGEDENLKEKYLSFLLKALPEDFRLQDKNIVLDCAHGATSGVAPKIFEKLGARCRCLFAEPDGRNINDNCGSQYTKSLEEAVREEGALLGLAFDGDGDRLIAVAEDGRVLTGDQLLYILAKFFKEKDYLKNPLLVSTVMSNIGFIKALKSLGIGHVATDVGDRAVFFAMKEYEAVLGGEESGHLVFSDHHTTGDGILSALMLLQALDHFKKPLSELASELDLAPKILLNVKVANKPELAAVPAIMEVIRAVEDQLGDEGRVLVRYSGTEPLCRVMVEGRTEDETSQLARKIAEAVEVNLN